MDNDKKNSDQDNQAELQDLKNKVAHRIFCFCKYCNRDRLMILVFGVIFLILLVIGLAFAGYF